MQCMEFVALSYTLSSLSHVLVELEHYGYPTSGIYSSAIDFTQSIRRIDAIRAVR